MPVGINKCQFYFLKNQESIVFKKFCDFQFLMIRHGLRSLQRGFDTNIENRIKFCVQVHINVNWLLSSFGEKSLNRDIQFKYLFDFCCLYTLEIIY